MQPNPPATLRVAILTSSRHLSGQWEKLLEGGGLRITAAYYSEWADFTRSLDSTHPDVALLDHDCIAPDPLEEAIGKILSHDANISVIVIANQFDPDAVSRALDAGAFRYLPKSHMDHMLPQTVFHAWENSLHKKTEEDLRFHRALYSGILEDQNQLICRFAPDGKLTYANSAYLQFFALPGESLIGLSLDQFLPPDVYQRLFARLASLTPEKPIVTNSHPEKRRNGTLGWYLWTNRAIYDQEGNLVEYQGVGEDISEQVRINEELEKRVLERTLQLETANRDLANEIASRRAADEALRASESRYRTLAEASQDYIYVLSPGGKIEYLNGLASQLISRPHEEIIGRPAKDFLPELQEEKLLSLLDTVIKSEKAFYVEGREPTTISGRQIGFGTWFIPIPSKESSRYSVLGISRDITERMQVENELQKMLEKERELGELKTRFITMTSHEFRTPLSTILSSAELLEHYGYRWPEQKKLEHLRRIEEAVRHLTTMLDEVLAIGKADAGKMPVHPKKMDLIRFCGNMVEEIQLSEGKDHKVQFFSPQAEIEVFLDDALLRQILGNLLSNSVKYSQPGSTIWLEADAGEAWVRLSVRDEGVGIPLEDRARLFEPFFRGMNVAHIPGTGLGLTIVQRSVNLMHGSVQVVTEENGGTQFDISLPRRLELAPAKEEDDDGDDIDHRR